MGISQNLKESQCYHLQYQAMQDLKDVGTTVLGTIWYYSLTNTASHLRSHKFPAILL